MQRENFNSDRSGFERLAALPTLGSPPGVKGLAVGAAVVHTRREKLSDVGTDGQNSDDEEKPQDGLCHEWTLSIQRDVISGVAGTGPSFSFRFFGEMIDSHSPEAV